VYSLYIDFCMCVYVCYIYLILFISLGYDIMSHVFFLFFFFRVQKNFTDYTLGVCVYCYPLRKNQRDWEDSKFYSSV